MICSKSQGLRSKVGQQCNSQLDTESLRTRRAYVQGQEKMDILAQAENKFAFPPPCVLFRPSVDPTLICEGDFLLSLQIQMLNSS